CPNCPRSTPRPPPPTSAPCSTARPRCPRPSRARPMSSSPRSTAMNPSTPDFLPGTVTLVGAGPGDPELLTLKAVRAIRAATVLLVDDLVNEAVLAHAQPSARIVHVGKRGGCRSTPQAFIDKLMLMAAREGEVVVRVKGGDPFIFGRGGEET